MANQILAITHKIKRKIKMAINIIGLNPASVKSKNVATEDYVDTSVSNIDVSGDINANNDEFAQKLGYLNYADMVAKAAVGQTIISGGYVNTSLIDVGTINAGMINTTGLIAENISANEIIGKRIVGSVIEGAVIKASYLDLDGELEVLTNYHISVAMYNANPSLYTDAVYLSADNEYRIPSISSLSENGSTAALSNFAISNGSIHAYNIANVGNNQKAVKIRPVFVNTGSVILKAHRFSDTNDSAVTKTSTSYLRLGTMVLATITKSIYSSRTSSSASLTVSSPYASTVSIHSTYQDTSYLFTSSVYVPKNESRTESLSATIFLIPAFGDVQLDLTSTGTHYYINNGDGDPYEYLTVDATMKLTVQSGSYTLPFDWDNLSVFNIYTPSANGYTGYIKLSGIGINNLA